VTPFELMVLFMLGLILGWVITS